MTKQTVRISRRGFLPGQRWPGVRCGRPAVCGRVHRVQWHRINVHGQGVPHLRMSTKGRQLARSWTGVKAYKAPPPGTLKEWH
jgi:hypothetical protein